MKLCSINSNTISNTTHTYKFTIQVDLIYLHHQNRSSSSRLHKNTKYKMYSLMSAQSSTNHYSGLKKYDHMLPITWPNHLELTKIHWNHPNQSRPHTTPSNKRITLFFLQYRIPDQEICSRINTECYNCMTRFFMLSVFKKWVLFSHDWLGF